MKVILSAALALGFLASSSVVFAAPMRHGHPHCVMITKKTVHHGHVVITHIKKCD